MGKYIGARGLNYLWSKTKEGLDGKQDVVEDLADIRSGAAAGATAVQPGDNVSSLVNDAHYVQESEMVVPNVNANGHEYVDLGLPSGTLWATMNVGASTPEGYGNYYMYGYTTPYNSSNTPYSGTENPLSLEHDAARVNWGGDWHMPTKAQMEELVANTTYEWTTINGINGGKFTAKNGSGNYIFIPAAGYYSRGNLYSVGTYGSVWSSAPYGSSGSAYGLFFDSGYKSVDSNYCRSGYSVRGVLPPITMSPKYATKEELSTVAATIPAAQIQADWNQTDTSAKDFIKNKPVIPTVPETSQTVTENDTYPVSGGAVYNKLEEIIGTAPASLDTLGEIAAALNDDANLAATLTTQISTKIPKVSSPTNGNIPVLAADGTLTDSGHAPSEYVEQSDMVVPSADANGHEYVDLGLPSGTLWATMNVGASVPEGYGNYYMYGYTTPYSSSDTPYSGTEDLLSLEHDAARVIWGGDWKMPTKAQMEELVANTTYEWTTINGVNGGKFTAQNGNYVFFPAAGNWLEGEQSYVGLRGNYLSSTPLDIYETYYLLIADEYDGMDNYSRELGLSVRGVLPPITMSSKYATKQELNTGLSGKAEKSEMSVTAGTGADADKTTIQLKTGTSATVLTQHQDISGKAEKNEMSVTPGTGTDADKTTIQLKTGTSATVLTQHQDISGKQDVISDLADIRSGAALGATAVQTETDPTVPAWAKQQSKPSYSYSEISGTPTNVSAFTNDAGYLTQHQDISGKVNSAVSVTYSQLVGLRTNSGLVAGQLYRITDFVTTVNSEEVEARSAGHQFDVIVRADSTNTLNENAWAARHAGDTYFANSRLEAWQLKYMLDNEYWSDATNGKGVITWMKDEFDNECPYDFKNVQYKRYKVSDPKHRSLVDNEYIAYGNCENFDGIQIDTNDYKWMYTYSHKNNEILEAVDCSLNSVEGESCNKNRIKGYELDTGELSNNVLLSYGGSISGNICTIYYTTLIADMWFSENSINGLATSIIISGNPAGNTINSNSGNCFSNFINTSEFLGNVILANQFYSNVITGRGFVGCTINGNFVSNTLDGYCNACEFLDVGSCTISSSEGFNLKFIYVYLKTITETLPYSFVSTDSNDNLVIWNPADCPTKSEVAQTMVASQSVRNVVVLTQQEYDALATKDNYTEYNIV